MQNKEYIYSAHRMLGGLQPHVQDQVDERYGDRDCEKHGRIYARRQGDSGQHEKDYDKAQVADVENESRADIRPGTRRQKRHTRLNQGPEKPLPRIHWGGVVRLALPKGRGRQAPAARAPEIALIRSAMAKGLAR